MKNLAIFMILILTYSIAALAQKNVKYTKIDPLEKELSIILLRPDESVDIPALKFNTEGELMITASSTSSNRDFDPLVGEWVMYHRRLNERFANSDEWTEFASTDKNSNILNNKANTDIYSTTEMPGMEGELFEGSTLRLFNPKTNLWSLYWAASDTGVLDPPVIGSFENKVGHFFTKDTIQGKDVIIVFRWDLRIEDKPIWSQAFTDDKGETWEWNWLNVSIKN